MSHKLFAHTGEHSDAAVPASENLLSVVAHQPTWVALALSVFVLLSLFGFLSLFNVKLVNRLLALMPALLALALIFFTHNPLVASLLLSSGFILVFFLAFLLIRIRE